MLLALLAFTLALASGRAQDVGGVGSGTTSGSIIVYVREASGSPLTSPAEARLYRSDGTPRGRAMTSGAGQTTFRNLPLGDYYVEVEAAGYKTGRGEASLPIPVTTDVQIYLQAESEFIAEPVVSGPGSILAPKAKKELNAGLQALREGKLADAEKNLSAANALAPGNSDILYLLGILYVRLKDLPRAQSVLEKATQIDPHHARALAALGTTLANQSKFAEAIPPLEQSLQLNAHSWETRWTLAKAYYYKQRYEPALKESQAALQESNGKAPEIELLVAQALTATARFEESAQVLRKFLLNHPDDPQTPLARKWLERLKNAGKISGQ
ncbi:MAG: tetratricopeptide repeat protein [Acidipila sp.]|nr:tetratricopeptide repeat protein [Acidipila sp.]